MARRHVDRPGQCPEVEAAPEPLFPDALPYRRICLPRHCFADLPDAIVHNRLTTAGFARSRDVAWVQAKQFGDRRHVAVAKSGPDSSHCRPVIDHRLRKPRSDPAGETKRKAKILSHELHGEGDASIIWM